MNKEYLTKEMNEITYPGGQYFDIDTLNPIGEALKRAELMPKTMPEILEGGDTFLDVGCSKGFMCYHLKDKYKKLVGYDVYGRAINFAKNLSEYHNLNDRLIFIHGGMRDIPIVKGSLSDKNIPKFLHCHEDLFKYKNAIINSFDVVYCGSVTHHLYRDALRQGVKPYLFLKKLMALTKKYLIIDAPLDMSHNSLKVFAEQGNWTQEQKNNYTLDNHVKELSPYFKLVRVSINEKNRQTAVFKRVLPNIEIIKDSEVKKMIKEKGEVLKANSARPIDSIYKIGDSRVKYDIGLLPDEMFFILNSMPEYFAKTEKIIVDDNGKRIGDISEWINGDIGNINDFYNRFLEINNNLASIGFIEPHFKITDYKYRKNGQMVDVDVDMVMFSQFTRKEYIKNWRETKKELLKEKQNEIDFIADNWGEIETFTKVRGLK
jgi:SAM-dependent methyltransferase